ncbi:MAG: D-amino-acid oxidase [Thermoanaerobaculia bacterium]|jgi:D-amino-acid oxidase|nr:D-amino-acid oxidase [Thermoanaerobaculia bacterium]
MSRVAVIGAGVSGLTSGVVLAESGYDVTLFAAEVLATTSAVAGAIWYPYHIKPKAKVERWGRSSYDEFVRLARDRTSGVELIEFRIFSIEVKRRPPRGIRGRSLEPEEIPAAYRYGFAITVPVMETPRYLPYLRRRFRKAGGRIRQKTIGDLRELTPKFDAVVNCSGYGAKTLCNDRLLRPGRGIVVLTPNPGIDRALVYAEDPKALMYVIPRRNDCVLGGCDDEVESTIVSPAMARAIHARCRRIEKSLPAMVATKVGIRPVRSEVRLEIERVDGTPIVHNYGHGGAGFTVSWGCAREVLRKVERAFGVSR